MISTLQRLPGNTIELTITLSWSDVYATYTKIRDRLISEIELPGFRKGKAPKDLAEKNLQKTKIYEEVLKELVPLAYADALKIQHVSPIISPSVEVVEANENKDWKFVAKTCEAPEIKLGNYKKALADLKANKKTSIWVPGKSETEAKEKNELKLGEVLDILYKEVTVDLSPLLIEQEVNRLMSNLVNELQKLGMTVEQYLQSQGKTAESLRSQYSEQAKKTLSLEFALEVIANNENVIVSDSEVAQVIKNAKNDTERQALEKERYFLSRLLRRQKTISKLLESPVVKP